MSKKPAAKKPGRPLLLPEPWKSLAQAHGGMCRLAEACGVVPFTIYRWSRDEMRPGLIMRRHVDALARKAKLPSPWGQSPVGRACLVSREVPIDVDWDLSTETIDIPLEPRLTED